MRRVAHINGVNVYSDKRVTSIIITRVVFSDGSSCDVSTRSIDNRGPGTIRIGEGEESGQEQLTKGPNRYSAKGLHFKGVTARVTIDPWDMPDMELTISGPAHAVNGTDVKVTNDVLRIEGNEPTASGISIHGISVQGRRSMVVSAGNIVISGDQVLIGNDPKPSNEVMISLKVPKGTPITLDNLFGSARIGDVEGDFNLNATGWGQINVGRAKRATIQITGKTDVYITEVEGLLTAQIAGSGKVEVAAGSVASLIAQVTGSGNFRFGGTTDTAALSTMGSGCIHVHKVKSPPMQTCMGSGSINIG